MRPPPSPTLPERILKLEKQTGNYLEVTKGCLRRRSMGSDEFSKLGFPSSNSTGKTEHRRVASASVAFPSTGAGEDIHLTVPGTLSRKPSQIGLGVPTNWSVRERRRSYIELTQARSTTAAAQPEPEATVKPKSIVPHTPKAVIQPIPGITSPGPEAAPPPTPEVIVSPTPEVTSPLTPEPVPSMANAIVQATLGVISTIVPAAIPPSTGVVASTISQVVAPPSPQAIAPPSLQIPAPPTFEFVLASPEVTVPPTSALTTGPTSEDAPELKSKPELALVTQETGRNTSIAQDLVPSPRCGTPANDYYAENLNSAIDVSDTHSVMSPGDTDEFDEVSSPSSGREFTQDEHTTDDLTGDAFTSMSGILQSDASLDEKLGRLKNLSGLFWKWFSDQGDIANLESTILVERQLVDLAPDSHPEKPSYLKNFSISLQKRFAHFGDSVDSEQASLYLYRAIELAPDRQGNKASWLNDLSRSLFERYRRLKDPADLDNAILRLRQAVYLTQDGSAKKLYWLINLSNWLEFKYKRFKDSADLDDAILFNHHAVALIPDDHSQKLFRVVRLGSLYLIRFKNLHNPIDLDKAIDAQRLAISLLPDGHLNKPSLLNDLGTSLSTRFRESKDKDEADINLAIDVQQQAVVLTPDGHPQKASYLSHLGSSFESRFRHQKKAEDLDNAILSYQRAADLVPDGSPEKPARLASLATALLTRYRRSKNLDDLTTSITAQRQSAALTPDNHPSKLSKLKRLVSPLETRLQRLGNYEDLDEAIAIQRQIVDLVPDGRAEKPDLLANLGRLLLKRLKHGEETDCSLVKQRSLDLDDAITAQRRAADLTHKDDSNKYHRLNSLAKLLQKRFERLGDVADSNEAIASHEQAVNLAPEGHANKHSLPSTPSVQDIGRHQRAETSPGSDSALFSPYSPGFLSPVGYPHKPAQINTLSSLSEKQLERHTNSEDQANLISSSRQRTLNLSGSTEDRYRAACSWARLAHPDLEPYHVVFALIPRLLWFGKFARRRFEDLEELKSTLLDAVSAACTAGKYGLALEWLEQSRTIIWGQTLLLPSPLDNLHAVYPKLAQELSTIALALETANMDYTKPDKAPADGTQTGLHPAGRWVALITKVRELPDFSDFLRSKSASVLESGAYDGPVVLINVTAHRSDAIIIKPKTSSVGNVHLSNLSLAKLASASESLTSLLQPFDSLPLEGQEQSASQPAMSGALLSVLEMLWKDVVKPVLGYLGLGPELPRASQLVHITWCVSGELACLPLHAAGIYQGPDKGEKIFNYAVSSYTPSLTALFESLSYPRSAHPNVLAIGWDSTFIQSPTLPGAKQEVDKVEGVMQQFDLPITRINEKQANVSGVSEAMGHHNWIHFACPGTTDAHEPTQSAFHLHDGRLELGALMKQPLKHAELAILTQCQTAKSRGKFPDEAVHLPVGMFLAGYRSVVGTLWSARAADTQIVVQEFYHRLLEHQEEGIASALHHAVTALRGTAGDDDLLSWVPYIHIGC